MTAFVETQSTTEGWTHTALAQVLRFGVAAVDTAGELVSALGRDRAVLITSARGARSDAASRLARALGDRLVDVFDGGRSHTPWPVVTRATEAARSAAADVVVSLGGGSCIDLAKAVTYFLQEDPPEADAGSPFDRAAVAHLSVPTTYSGSEVTAMFATLDPTGSRKVGRTVLNLAPQAVIYDPMLTVGLPATVTAETAFNALAHALEGSFATSATPEAQVIGVEAVRRIVDALPAAMADPTALSPRIELLTGACLAARCLQNGRMGIHHGLAQVLGAVTGLPHGTAHAVLLPHTIRFVEPSVRPRLERVASALGVADVPALLAGLQAHVGLPVSLAACGLQREQLHAVAAAAPDNRNVKASVVPITAADALNILLAAFGAGATD